MRIKEWYIFLKNEGRQLNFVVFSGVVASTLYFCAVHSSEFMDWMIMPLIKGVALFLALYYFAYSVILTKR